MTLETRGAQLLGRTLGGRYRLVALVGTGASAAVYLAEDTSLGRRVAVKVLHPGVAHDPGFQKRFRAEARASAALGHPHVLAVYDWGEQSDGAYLVTELLEGGSLRDLLAAGDRLTPSQALVVGLHAAQGLDYAHRHGFVHRDIKPANLLFGRDQRLRVADFGIARAVAEATWTEPEGVLVGTARYAAPEQATAGPIDGRADVYSLALTLIEAATGAVPLVGDTPLATMALRQAEPVPVPDGLGPLAALLEQAGSVDPATRPSAAAFAEGLLGGAAQLDRPAPLPLAGLHLAAATTDERPTADAGPSVDDTDPLAASTTTWSAPDLDRPEADAGGRDTIETVDDAAVFGTDPSEPTGSEVTVTVFDVERVEGAVDHTAISGRRRRRRWPWVVLVLLILSAGGAAAAWWQVERTRIPTYEVGDYVGSSIEAVRQEVEAHAWLVLELPDRRDGTEPGQVLEQSPPPGELLEEGAELTLVVSEGQLLRTVPELAGLTVDDATASLVAESLTLGGVNPAFDEEAPAAQVLSASQPAGAELETGSAVDLVVSDGPAPRTIPDVAAAAPAEAVAAVEALGLVAVVHEEHHGSVPEGSLISMSPAPGEQVERGATVDFVVSLGRPWVTVPDVVGLGAAEASDRLEAAGFVVVDTVGPPNRPVLITDPPAGETYRQGRAVTIITRSS
jgi:eukaryotic-like serine/threonine-protein kinase